MRSQQQCLPKMRIQHLPQQKRSLLSKDYPSSIASLPSGYFSQWFWESFLVCLYQTLRKSFNPQDLLAYQLRLVRLRVSTLADIQLSCGADCNDVSDSVQSSF